MLMVIVYLLIIMLITEASVRFSVYSLLKSAILFFHQSCLNQIPTHALASAELKALVCAENFQTAETTKLYIASGLIHLFVVSGAHLILLENIIYFLSSKINKKPNSQLMFTFLTIYSLACGMNPPIARSWIGYGFNLYLKKNKLHWPAGFRLLLIGLMTILFNPTWITSLSLQLSWLAALSISAAQIFLKDSSLFWKQSLSFIFLTPLLLFLTVTSLIVIICNLILAPILEFFLFPLGLFVWFIPVAYPLFDSAILGLNQILKFSELTFSFQYDLNTENINLLGWILILFFHFLIHLTEIQSRKLSYV